MRIEGSLFVLRSSAVVLHGFDCSMNFGEMLLSRLTADNVRRRSPCAVLSLPFVSRIARLILRQIPPSAWVGTPPQQLFREDGLRGNSQ